MCGIFGQIGRVNPAAALKMSHILRHRGPDDEGFLVADSQGIQTFAGPDTAESTLQAARDEQALRLESVTDDERAFLLLGHRRLSIVDLSPKGHQPMNYGGRYWITYNGEVYNYRELRKELEVLGHFFGSDTDTEVILAAFSEWGPECLHRFNGMWAFAVYDAIDKSLFIARDRFGIKPLYFWPHSKGVAFASEIKAFTAFPEWQPRPNLDRVRDFLIWNISDHSSETLFAGVTQLPAGHSLTIDLAAATEEAFARFNPPQPVRWYDLERRTSQRSRAGARDVRLLLEDAVRLRLRADVPVGSCLSGGVDSSAIVSVMGHQLANANSLAQLRTVTARSLDQAFDEGAYASLVANSSGATPIEVTPTPTGLFEELDQLVWHQDEPFVSTSIYAQWVVFQAARRSEIVVMLDGQGADETFGGYRGFFGAALAGLARRGQIKSWLSEARALRETAGFSLVRSLGYTLAYLFPRSIRLVGRFDRRSYSDWSWLADEFRDGSAPDPLAELGARSTAVSSMSIAQLQATNLPMLLRWEDRNSMAHSIEARVPFLDYRLVEMAVALPDKEKVSGGISKRILRQAMRGLVPDPILDRKDKMGFVTAEPLWATRDLAPRFKDELVAATATLPCILSPKIVDQFDEVVAGKRSFDFRFWRAIVLSRWARCFNVDFTGGHSL